MSILAQIGTKIGSEIKNLGIRMSSAETAIVNLGGQEPPPTNLTINPVTWTNLTEINLSGEKLTNADFSTTITQYVTDPDNDGSSRGEGLSPVKLIALTDIDLRGTIMPSGTILHGVGGGGSSNELIRIEDPNDPRDYPYSSNNQGTGTWDWEPFSNRGTSWEYAKEEDTPYQWSVQSGTLDQAKLEEGIIKGVGGGVTIRQTFNNPIAIGTKIVAVADRTDNISGNVFFKHLTLSGTPLGQNIPIDGSAEYEVVDYQMGGVIIGTGAEGREISSVSLFQGAVSGGSVQVNGNGGIEKISGASGYNAGASSTNFIAGNSNGYVQFQWGAEFKSQKIGLTYQDQDYGSISPFELNINGNGHVYTNGSNQFSGGAEWATQGDYFRIRHYASDNTIRFQRREEIFDNGESIGTDYVTFHIHSELSNGDNLYVDTSLFHVGSRLNDVLLAR